MIGTHRSARPSVDEGQLADARTDARCRAGGRTARLRGSIVSARCVPRCRWCRNYGSPEFTNRPQEAYFSYGPLGPLPLKGVSSYTHGESLHVIQAPPCNRNERSVSDHYLETVMTCDFTSSHERLTRLRQAHPNRTPCHRTHPNGLCGPHGRHTGQPHRSPNSHPHKRTQNYCLVTPENPPALSRSSLMNLTKGPSLWISARIVHRLRFEAAVVSGPRPRGGHP